MSACIGGAIIGAIAGSPGIGEENGWLPIFPDLSAGLGDAVAITIVLGDYYMIASPGWPTRPSLTGAGQFPFAGGHNGSDVDVPICLPDGTQILPSNAFGFAADQSWWRVPNGTTITVLACEAGPLVAAGIAAYA